MDNTYPGWNKDKHMNKILAIHFLKKTSQNKNKSQRSYIWQEILKENLAGGKL